MQQNQTDLTTVEKIAELTKSQVQIYRKFPSKKAQVVDALRPVFGINSDSWPRVIVEGKFREGFLRKLGKGGMKSLKKLLFELDKDHYKSIDFGDE